ncbi:MAG: hypothetical protein HC859_04590 [Bacteroidia bacterium]|nr:hypothetical protein [Bacteroidia bacterium]
MVKAFFKVAFRNFVNERFFSLINLAGLSIGIAVALLIAVFIAHEVRLRSLS